MAEEELEEIRIPKELINRMGKHATEAGFDSVSGYVTYILGQVVEKLEGGKKQEESRGEGDEEIEEELKTLGYLK